MIIFIVYVFTIAEDRLVPMDSNWKFQYVLFVFLCSSTVKLYTTIYGKLRKLLGISVVHFFHLFISKYHNECIVFNIKIKFILLRLFHVFFFNLKQNGMFLFIIFL